MVDVTVVVPVFNAELHLAECLTTLSNLHGPSYEVILVDDGSTDASPAIAASFCEDQENFRYFRQKNSGVSQARNSGIELSRGKFVTFVDADDTVDPAYLNVLICPLQTGRADMVVCEYDKLYGSRRRPGTRRLAAGTYAVSDLEVDLFDDGTLSGCLFGRVWGVMYRTDLIISNNVRFDELLTFNEDGIFNICYLKHASSVAVLSEVSYIYRQHSLQVTRSNLALEEYSRRLKMASERFHELSEITEYDQIKRRTVSEFIWLCNYASNSIGVLDYFERCNRQYITDSGNRARVSLPYLRWGRLPNHKKVVAALIYIKSYFLIFLLAKFINFFQG